MPYGKKEMVAEALRILKEAQEIEGPIDEEDDMSAFDYFDGLGIGHYEGIVDMGIGTCVDILERIVD